MCELSNCKSWSPFVSFTFALLHFQFCMFFSSFPYPVHLQVFLKHVSNPVSCRIDSISFFCLVVVSWVGVPTPQGICVVWRWCLTQQFTCRLRPHMASMVINDHFDDDSMYSDCSFLFLSLCFIISNLFYSILHIRSTNKPAFAEQRLCFGSNWEERQWLASFSNKAAASVGAATCSLP